MWCCSRCAVIFEGNTLLQCCSYQLASLRSRYDPHHHASVFAKGSKDASVALGRDTDAGCTVLYLQWFGLGLRVLNFVFLCDVSCDAGYNMAATLKATPNDYGVSEKPTEPTDAKG